MLASKFGSARRPHLKPDAVSTLFYRQPSLQNWCSKAIKRTSTEAAVTQSGSIYSQESQELTMRRERSRVWLHGVVGSGPLPTPMYRMQLGILKAG